MIAGTEEAASPFFSPDGQWIGFLADDSIKKVSVEGGVPVAIHRSPGPAVNSGNTWGVGDTVIISGSANEGLSRASLAGDSMRPYNEWKHITDAGSATAWPHALPDGNYVTYVDTNQGSPNEAAVAALELQTLETKTLFRGATNPRYSSTGHLLFARGGSLYAVAFDSKKAKVTGVEQKLLDGVMTAKNGTAQFTVGGGGTLAYAIGDAGVGDDELIWVDRQGRTETILDASHLSEPRLSPDGTRLLVTSRTGANIDIWLFDLERSTFTRLTSDPGEDLGAVWSPDGTRLALASEIEDAAAGPRLAWMPSMNATPEVLVESTVGDWEFVSSWSPDGHWLAYTAVRGASQRGIWLFPIEREGAAEPVPFVDSPANEADGAFSPDGQWIAYVSDVSGRDEVYVRSFSDSERSSRPGVCTRREPAEVVPRRPGALLHGAPQAHGGRDRLRGNDGAHRTQGSFRGALWNDLRGRWGQLRYLSGRQPLRDGADEGPRDADGHPRRPELARGPGRGHPERKLTRGGTTRAKLCRERSSKTTPSSPSATTLCCRRSYAIARWRSDRRRFLMVNNPDSTEARLVLNRFEELGSSPPRTDMKRPVKLSFVLRDIKLLSVW